MGQYDLKTGIPMNYEDFERAINKTEADRNSARIAMKLFVKDWRDYLDKSGKDVHEYTSTAHIAMILSGDVYRVPDPLAMLMASEACAQMDYERMNRQVKSPVCAVSDVKMQTLRVKPGDVVTMMLGDAVTYHSAGVTSVSAPHFIATSAEPPPGPRKPPIGLQVEAHNPEAVDPDKAMSAVRAMCGGN